ncbi:hypothetical protein [Yinghuangia soli]|uniref:Uncharacterized protein n=1 Tax=Yinghuangia soli TaxID=2908204 RepID=A0AA41PYS2_9ACTN|nr:hypothetical protein [Yinghuangia soli]MCF2526947.1 hypothetical protein [Yinghuangia soli]
MEARSSGRVVAAGSVAAFLLVAAFGNQWLWEDLLKKSAVDEDSSWHILSWLNTPHWVVDKSGTFAYLEGTAVAGYLAGVLVLLATVALVLASASRRGGFNPFISGWYAMMLGGALCSVTSYMFSGAGAVTAGVDPRGEQRTLAGTLEALTTGAGYGLLAGWFVAIVCAFVAAGGGVRNLFQAPAPEPMPSVTYGPGPVPGPGPGWSSGGPGYGVPQQGMPPAPPPFTQLPPGSPPADPPYGGTPPGA